MCAGAVREGAWHAHDAVLEMLNLHDQGRGRLGGGESNNATGGFNGSKAAGVDDIAEGASAKINSTGHSFHLLQFHSLTGR